LARAPLASAVSHHRVTSSAADVETVLLAETSMPANLLASQTVGECNVAEPPDHDSPRFRFAA
jgi:hypothetical protein